MFDVKPERALPSEAFLSLQIKLCELLKKQVLRYTMGDSTSVPKETAQELLRSLCFTLQVADAGFPRDFSDLDILYLSGVKIIEDRIKEGKKLWKAACLSTPMTGNLALRDTLANIGSFWKQYDCRFFAHEIPCTIDYPLCHPVPESLLGIDYINEYLRRILTENELIGKFRTELVSRLLQNSCPDCKALLINLYEPVAGNVIGLSLIGSNPKKLDVTARERDKISRLFEMLSEEEATKKLEDAAKTACTALHLSNPSSARYLSAFSAGMYHRIRAASAGGSLRGVFPPCRHTDNWVKEQYR